MASSVLVVAAGLLVGCGGSGDGDQMVRDASASAPTSDEPSDGSSQSGTPTESAPPDEETPTTATPGECSPPTENVTYGTGTATLVVDNGPNAGTYDLSTDPEKTQPSRYEVGSGEQLIGNWRGDQEEQLPALEVRLFNEGDVCNGPSIVRIYLFALAYEDNERTTCSAKLDTLTTTAVSGSFSCTGIPRTFGTREPEALDASGTFSLGA